MAKTSEPNSLTAKVVEKVPTIEPKPLEKSNYMVLQDNKNVTLEFASKFVNARPVPVWLEKGLQSKLKNAQNNLENGNFETAIKLLDEIKDNRIDIVWHESNDLGHGTRARVRDA